MTYVLQVNRVSVPEFDDFVSSVNKNLAAGDGMYSGDDQYYLDTGASALLFMFHSLRAAGKSADFPRRILDYACGYGRVLRWLEAAFPEAHIVAADTDSKAVAAVGSLFRAEAHVLHGSTTGDIGRDFDLIWVGSLMTHVAKDHMTFLLNRFRDLLSDTGVVVFTTHGPYVAGRMRKREKVYGLDEADVVRILNDYDRSGHGFSPYPKQASYGISITTASATLSLTESAGLDPVYYQSRGWIRHQDGVAAVKA